jgi:hypothetical protein
MKKFPLIILALLFIACDNEKSSGKTSELATPAPPKEESKSAGSGCSAFIWFQKGVVMDYVITDATGKTTETSTTIDDVHQDGDALVADYTTTLGADKKIEAAYRCEGDKLYMDMKSLFSNFGTERAGVEMEVTDAFITFPWNMKEGDNLDDARFQIKTKQNGKEFMSMTSTVKNRKVESREQVTVPAGSYDCMKITEVRTTTTEMMGKQMNAKDTKSVQWFAPQAGLVKFELYDDAGKVINRSELVSLKGN